MNCLSLCTFCIAKRFKVHLLKNFFLHLLYFVGNLPETTLIHRRYSSLTIIGYYRRKVNNYCKIKIPAMKNKNRLGVTFIEMLITIAIIGILAGVVSIGFANTQKKAKDEKKISDIQKIKTALEVYRSDNTDRLYPAISAFFPPPCGGSFYTGSTAYLQPYPCSNDVGYIYAVDANRTKYSLRACLEDPQNTHKDVTNNSDPNNPDLLTLPSQMCPAGTASYTQKQP